MDGERFDALTRVVSDRASRRQAIAGILGGLGALALGRGASAQGKGSPPKAGQVCPPETTPCVAIANQPAHSRNINVSCCNEVQACYKCRATNTGRAPGRDSDVASVTIALCCRPGVDCPGLSLI